MNRIVLHGEIRSSKNSRQIFRNTDKNGKTRTIVAKSDNAKKQEVDYHWQLSDRANKAKWEAMTGNLEYPLRITFFIVKKTKRRSDYVNMVQNALDCMVTAGYLPDDDMDHVIPVFEPYTIDKENPRLEVWVEGSKVIPKSMVDSFANEFHIETLGYNRQPIIKG